MCGHERVVNDLPGVGMHHEDQRDGKKVERDEDIHTALPAAKAPRDGHRDEAHRRERDNDIGADVEIRRCQADPDELGDDGEEVEDEQVADRERAPEPAEALEDEARVTHAGHGPEPDDHLLVDDQHGDEQRQRPEQRRSEVLSRLRIGGDAAGVVVADHHDETGTHDGQQRQHPALPRTPGMRIVVTNGAERAGDVTDMRIVKNRGLTGRSGSQGIVRHELYLHASRWRGERAWRTAHARRHRYSVDCWKPLDMRGERPRRTTVGVHSCLRDTRDSQRHRCRGDAWRATRLRDHFDPCTPSRQSFGHCPA